MKQKTNNKDSYRKNKLMITNNENREITNNSVMEINKLDVVTAYEYLESIILDDGKIDLDITYREKKAINIFFTQRNHIRQQRIEKTKSGM